ncbi:MAG TPA: PepSY-associated TM helix domain-containing protein [Bacteroidales bacterium]|nr:PepSY-associated TM helix domain-containing protein [Bacteroidales bacterium]HQK37671.1 PepSY-associated TM helix domain-containing protein [Bacteroidales bacterium]
MSIRKWNRFLHRDLGYFFTGMTIIYGLSGIALNHRHQWNPNYIIRQTIFTVSDDIEKDSITDQYIKNLLSSQKLEKNYKKFYFPSPEELRIFIENGTVTVNFASGKGMVETIRKRPLFREINFLHYNSIKKLWTWFADLFALSLIFLAVSGLFILKGKNGITGRGAWLTIPGIVIPLLFLLLYFR